MTVEIDGVIKEWGDRLHYTPVTVRQRFNLRKGAFKDLGPQSKRSTSRNTTQLRDCLERTVNRVPEVLVKISGGGRNMGAIRVHLGYISRKGSLELEDELGEIFTSKGGIRDLCDSWGKGRIGISDKGGRCREAFNIILSMPPGTDRKSVKDAARCFAAELFSKHQYAFVAHEDEKHTDVHLSVKAIDKEGVRLNPRKADLQSWRELFAEKMREQGIAANATPRRARGVTQKSAKQAQHHMLSRDSSMDSVVLRDFSKLFLQKTKANAKHAHDSAALKIYRDLAQLLAKNSLDDRKLALKIVKFVQEMPNVLVKNKRNFPEKRTQGGKSRV